jgi:hypothetical protein
VLIVGRGHRGRHALRGLKQRLIGFFLPTLASIRFPNTVEFTMPDVEDFAPRPPLAVRLPFAERFPFFAKSVFIMPFAPFASDLSSAMCLRPNPPLTMNSMRAMTCHNHTNFLQATEQNTESTAVTSAESHPSSLSSSTSPGSATITGQSARVPVPSSSYGETNVSGYCFCAAASERARRRNRVTTSTTHAANPESAMNAAVSVVRGLTPFLKKKTDAMGVPVVQPCAD